MNGQLIDCRLEFESKIKIPIFVVQIGKFIFSSTEAAIFDIVNLIASFISKFI